VPIRWNRKGTVWTYFVCSMRLTLVQETSPFLKESLLSSSATYQKSYTRKRYEEKSELHVVTSLLQTHFNEFTTCPTCQTVLLRELDPDNSLLEEVTVFGVGEDGMPTTIGAKQYCVSIEQPNLTLHGVVDGMLRNEDCQTVPAIRRRYAEKVFAVLRVVAKALRYLHGIGIVHGGICTNSCSKYDNKWKISNIIGIRRVGGTFDEHRLAISAPPESVEVAGVSLKEDYEAHPSIDTWAYGKLAFEVLVGEPLFPSVDTDDLHQKNDVLQRIFLWNDYNLEEVSQKLIRACVSEAGRALILDCLSAQPERRPTMSELLARPFWNEIRRPGRTTKTEGSQ